MLLVEDEPTLRTLTARVLRDLGYQVLEASHGAQAIELVLAQTQPLQLLLTDIVMPGMRGASSAEPWTRSPGSARSRSGLPPT